MLRLLLNGLGPVLLIALGVASSALALIFTGGDSFLAGRSAGVYGPWLLALGLTLPGLAASYVLADTVAEALLAGALLAYAATFALWLAVLPQSS